MRSLMPVNGSRSIRFRIGIQIDVLKFRPRTSRAKSFMCLCPIMHKAPMTARPNNARYEPMWLLASVYVRYLNWFVSYTHIYHHITSRIADPNVILNKNRNTNQNSRLGRNRPIFNTIRVYRRTANAIVVRQAWRANTRTPKRRWCIPERNRISSMWAFHHHWGLLQNMPRYTKRRDYSIRTIEAWLATVICRAPKSFGFANAAIHSRFTSW